MSTWFEIAIVVLALVHVLQFGAACKDIANALRAVAKAVGKVDVEVSARMPGEERTGAAIMQLANVLDARLRGLSPWWERTPTPKGPMG